MSLSVIERIVQPENIQNAIKAVKKKKGAPGIDKMKVGELQDYFDSQGEEVIRSILEMRYKPQPVKRTYIPKANGKQRPLGIPVVVDRVIQQAVSQILMEIYDNEFSDSSFGFRPNRGAHGAVEQALRYLNEGYQWVIDLDIEKFFDRVNHDKLISIIRNRINDKPTLHLIRSFLKAGVMENGLVSPSELGTPQGGNLSPVLSLIYLDQLDKELERRGLRYCRYADDVVIFVRTEMAAERVMKSISSWLQRKLFLTASPTKTKIVRPNNSSFLGFSFWNCKGEWKAKVGADRKQVLIGKLREILCRRKAMARSLAETFTKVNQVVRGWINYYCIGSMRGFMKSLGEWLRHKIRVIILKQWKRPRTIFKNLSILNRKYKCGFTVEEILQTANSHLGVYKSASMRTWNFILSPKVLGLKYGERPGLINPVKLYDTRTGQLKLL